MQLNPNMRKTGLGRLETIPVWSRYFGSWCFSISRRPFAVNELEGHYDKASDRWHTTISKLGFEAAYADLIDQAQPELSKTEPNARLKVLDAGIGTGAFAGAFASSCLRPIDLTGLDVSSEMLRQAENNLNSLVTNASFYKGDINDLPFAEHTFDVVLVAHVIEHMAEPDVALAELSRVLKPGGFLVACITQRSSAGAYIQFKWRTHRVDEYTAAGWFHRSGLSGVRAIKLKDGSTAQRFSTGYVAVKTPEAASEGL